MALGSRALTWVEVRPASSPLSSASICAVLSARSWVAPSAAT